MHATLTTIACSFALMALMMPQSDERSTLGDRVQSLTRDSSWTLASSVPVKFRTYHPQGMVRVGDALFVSSVEVTVRTKRFADPVGGFDRDTGEGVGHLLQDRFAGQSSR